MRKRVITGAFAIVAAMMVWTGSAANAAASFADVSADRASPAYSEFAAEISWLAGEGISTGWDSGDGVRRFRPWQPITRDAMAAFLYRYAGSPEVDELAAVPFSDVPDDSEFTHEIAWLASTGISTGWEMGDGSRQFRPWDPITRDAMAAFLYRYAGSPHVGTDSGFVDVTARTPFATEIGWLHRLGVTAGYDLPGGSWSFIRGLS
ncbi:S-layer homology domain-containing protein [Microbacterium suwonense]|uniref:SLH domain-containing protein n=1 Tax=Microbacterium suwonense TaxID=683047 RepID=A0ABN6X4V8_9MICO|nr:S-layer homology domain-containing protein [Microbacterium suwonense]BDZ38776.1 hypothetical protein GCM10025863_13900 [Microbacterium suwonense]